MDGEGASAPADYMIVVRDSVSFSLGEVGVGSGAGESELQEREFYLQVQRTGTGPQQ